MSIFDVYTLVSRTTSFSQSTTQTKTACPFNYSQRSISHLFQLQYIKHFSKLDFKRNIHGLCYCCSRCLAIGKSLWWKVIINPTLVKVIATFVPTLSLKIYYPTDSFVFFRFVWYLLILLGCSSLQKIFYWHFKDVSVAWNVLSWFINPIISLLSLLPSLSS